VKRRFAVADVLTALRLPLAAVFPFVHAPMGQLTIVAIAALTDVADGFLARRFGASRAGAVLDPVVDKVFMAVAFITIARRGLLDWYELVGVLLRDILAVLGFVATWLLRRPVALPARAGGKAVTIMQLLTLVAAIADWTYTRHLAWATAAIAVYAIWDYGRTAARRTRRSGTAGVGSGMRIIGVTLASLVIGAPLSAQQFQPPKNAKHSGTRIGLYGFGVRGGIDFRRSEQVIIGSTLDLGNLFSDRIRLRPSAEIGLFNGPNTYVANVEALWRFTPADEATTPYIGLGLGVAGRDGCGTDPQCPDVWLNVVFGFELHYRSTFNWLLEYHGMDAMRRHRFYIGLTTRRGN
jgi:phosphatidylglycerophosphate synthase